MSRVGKKIIPIPKGVELKMSGRTVTAKGPKGVLSYDALPGIELDVMETTAQVRQTSTEKTAGAIHGLSRAMVNNLVEGVSTGFTKALEIHGTGYRAQVQDRRTRSHSGVLSPHRVRAPRGDRRESGAEQDRHQRDRQGAGGTSGGGGSQVPASGALQGQGNPLRR